MGAGAGAKADLRAPDELEVRAEIPAASAEEVYDALAKAYLVTVEASLRTQARGLDLARHMIDEALSAQQEARGLAEQLVGHAANSWR